MSTIISVSPRVKLTQRIALTMLVLSGVLNYIDRATLAVGNELIRHDLGLSTADMGILLSSFLWAYAFAQLPAGAMVDRFGPRLLLSLGITLWSIAQMLGGLVSSFSQFIGARVLLGLGEAPQFPTGARVVRDWFSARDRGLATGIFNCAGSLGTAIGVPVLTALMLAFGWRWMFAVMGLSGLVVAAVWYRTYRNPNDIALEAEENAYLTDGDLPYQKTKVTFEEWRQLFRFRSTWGMILGFFGSIYLLWLYSAWLPAYLETQRHMSIRSTGFFAAIPFLCGVVGGVFGGYLVDILVRRGMSQMASRTLPAALALFVTSICTIAAAFVESNMVAILFIAISMFMLFLSGTCAWALTSVAVPKNCTASIGSMQNFGGYLGGALAPTITGIIVQTTGSFVPAMVVGACIGTVSGIVYLTMISNQITEEDIISSASRA